MKRVISKNSVWVVTVIILFSGLLAGVSIGAWGNQSIRTKQELKELQSDIHSLLEKIDSDHQKSDVLTNELDQLEREIVAEDKVLNQALKNRESLNKRINDLKVERKVLAQQKVAQTANLQGLIRSSYLIGSNSGLKVLLSGDNPHHTTRKLAILRYILRAKQKQLDNLLITGKAIEKNQGQIEIESVAFNQIIEKIEQSQDDLRIKQREKAQKVENITNSISEGQSLLGLYQAKEQSLEKLLNVLNRQSVAKSAVKKKKQPLPNSPAKTDRSEDRKIDQKANKVVNTVSTHAKNGKKSPENSRLLGLSKQPGRLSLPIEADIVTGFGQKKPESGLDWEGLQFRSISGQKVRSIYTGQVVFAGWFRGYGQLIVIDHGAGFMSLYGYNQSIQAVVGDQVREGQVIAQSGGYQQRSSPGLYFEIRHNGLPTDPLKWCRR